MTRARATLVSLDDTPYYHCVGRCVRRAFLCGIDTATGHSYEHRRGWIEQRLKLLAEVFAIELCAYALMGNHYHLVVKLNPAASHSWSDTDILERWTQLFAGPAVAQKALRGHRLNPSESMQVKHLTELWRERLGDLSWFMRCLNEFIARKANAEDQCTGHFWEGRFKSQALLDDTAVITAMAYVDLNPVRAGIAESIPESDYTSAQARWRSITDVQTAKTTPQTPRLLPFMAAERTACPEHLPFNLQDYLALLGDTGCAIVAGKGGFIASSEPTLLTRLGVAPNEWLATVTQLQQRYDLAVGAPHRLRHLARRWGTRWIRGLGQARRLYPAASG